MMNLWVMIFVLSAIVSALIVLNVRSALKFRKWVSGMPSQSPQIGEPLVPISVIISCKGDDGRLFDNLQTYLNQDYSPAEFVLVSALAEDPAQAVFTRLREANPGRRIKTVVAGIHPVGSEKNNNLLKALAVLDPGSEVLVFFDSDGKSDRLLTRKLVSALVSSSFAGVSGYRWYQPRWNVLPDVLRTAWNGSGYLFLLEPHTSFLWAGAMAIRRKTFDESGMAKIWATSFSTDTPLRVRFNELGLETQFLPNCIVLSSEKDSWASLFSFTSRHTLLPRLYQKPFFVVLFLENVIGNIFGFGLLIWGLSHGIEKGAQPTALIGFLWIAHFWLFGALIIDPIQKILKASEIEVTIQKGLLIFVGLLVSLYEGYCVIYALFVKRVRWAGITYEIHNGVAKRL